MTKVNSPFGATTNNEPKRRTKRSKGRLWATERRVCVAPRTPNKAMNQLRRPLGFLGAAKRVCSVSHVGGFQSFLRLHPQRNNSKHMHSP